jgi:XRE family transcriptional regulator, master regulator for biofilm formation
MSPKQLGAMVTKLRGKRMTQEQLAKRAKVSRSYLAAIEAGHRKNPSLDVLKRLAKALNRPLSDLLE